MSHQFSDQDRRSAQTAAVKYANTDANDNQKQSDVSQLKKDAKKVQVSEVDLPFLVSLMRGKGSIHCYRYSPHRD